MGRAIELIIILALLAFSFFSGVKYSNLVKERAAWLFEEESNIQENAPGAIVAPKINETISPVNSSSDVSQGQINQINQGTLPVNQVAPLPDANGQVPVQQPSAVVPGVVQQQVPVPGSVAVPTQNPPVPVQNPVIPAQNPGVPAVNGQAPVAVPPAPPAPPAPLPVPGK